MRCPSCHHEDRDEELRTLLEVVPQQIFVLGPDTLAAVQVEQETTIESGATRGGA